MADKIFQNAQNPDNNAGKDVGDWNTHTLLVGMQNYITHCGKTVEQFLTKLSMH